jgi:hypothetical protein
MAIQILPSSPALIKPPKPKSKKEQFAEAFSNIAQEASQFALGQQQLAAQSKAEREKEEFTSQLRGKRDLDLETLKGQNKLILENDRWTGKKLLEDIKKVHNSASENQIKETGQKAFDIAANTLKKGNLGIGSGIYSAFGGETARDTGEFQTALGGLEAMLVDMVSRGTLSNARFQYITQDLLPKPTDSQNTIKGKLTSLASILNLDPSALTGMTGESKRPSLESFFR